MLNFTTVIGLILCAAAFYGIGRFILDKFKLTESGPIEDWVISSSIGLIVISTLVMIAGFLHILHPATLWIILLGSLILGGTRILSLLKMLISMETVKRFLSFALWEKSLIVLIVIYLFIRFFNTFAPVLTWDATTHHYLVPAMYLKAGRIYDFPHVLFSYYPSLVEMLYTFGMGLVYDILSNHIGWYFGPLTVGAIYVVGKKFMSRRIGLIAAGILLSMGGIGIQLDGGYVDLPQALFCLLCFWKLLDWRETQKLSDLLFAALFFSANLASKHLGYAFLPPVLFYIGWVTLRERREGIVPALKNLIVFFAVCLLLPLPWYIRSWILTENPFFPFPIFGFPTLRYPPLELSTWANPAFSKNIWSLITYLWYLTTDLRLDEALGKRFAPYFLGLLPFFWIAFRRGVYFPRLLFLLCLYFMGFVFITAPVKTRYMLFFMPFLALLAADILDKLFISTRKHKLLTYLAVILLFIPLITNTIHSVIFIKEHTFDVIIGKRSQEQYLLRESPRNWGVIRWMNIYLPEDARLLAIEARMYGLDRDWITWLGLNDEPIPTTPEDNVRLWRDYKFTHLWLGDDTTVKTLMYYNIYNLPGDEDDVVFTLEDLWFNFFGEPFADSVINKHWTKFWLPRELKLEGYEWYVDGVRQTDESGRPLYKAKRGEIEADPRKMAQIYFVDSIRELERTGGLHIIYPPPDGSIKEDLTYILECDYVTYQNVHEDVRSVGG